jgi:hypothetical protein
VGEKALHVGLHPRPISPVWQVPGQVTDRIPCPTLGPVPLPTRQQRLGLDRMQAAGAAGLKALVFDHREV